MTALHTEEYRRFIVALTEARMKAGLTQCDLADRLGVDQSFVSKYEGCNRRLDVIEFLRIIAAIGSDPTDVISKIGELGSFRASRGYSRK